MCENVDRQPADGIYIKLLVRKLNHRTRPSLSTYQTLQLHLRGFLSAARTDDPLSHRRRSDSAVFADEVVDTDLTELARVSRTQLLA